MKTMLFILTTIFLIFTGYTMSLQYEYLSQEEKIVNNILDNTARIIEKKYKIQPSGEGAAMPEGVIRDLTLTFDTKGPFTKDYLRKLLIECAQELLNQINTNKSIQPFLEKIPFTIENVQIIIYNRDKNGREAFDPEISTARISQGVLIYRTVDSSDTFKFKNRFNETYDEALKALSTIKD
jgi:hypothetical protein